MLLFLQVFFERFEHLFLFKKCGFQVFLFLLKSEVLLFLFGDLSSKILNFLDEGFSFRVKVGDILLEGKVVSVLQIKEVFFSFADVLF
jgi:hypothetical protein